MLGFLFLLFFRNKMPGVSDFKFRPCLFRVKYIPYFLMFGETKKSINGFFVVNEELTPNWWQNVLHL